MFARVVIFVGTLCIMSVGISNFSGMKYVTQVFKALSIQYTVAQIYFF